ncbi:19151_t:CDS:2, partial [Entrophospora sp. SA101]
AENMVNAVKILLVELGVSSKVLGITTDNASAMVAFGREIKNELSINHNNPHVTHHCFGAHILNIAVQHGLQVHDDTIKKELIDVLSPFYSATLLLSSLNYSTIGEFHFTLWTLVKNLYKQIEVSNTQYIVANSILYKLEQYFELPDEAKMMASLLDPPTKSTTFTTDEITRTVTAIKCKLIHYNSNFNVNNNNTSTITTNNQTAPSQIIKNRIDAHTHIRSLAKTQDIVCHIQYVL